MDDANLDQLHTAEVSSSDGWNSLSIQPKKMLTVNGQPALLVEMQIKGKFWSREQSLDLNSELTELSDDYVVSLPQLILTEERIKDFRQLLEDWLTKPHEFTVELSAGAEPLLSVFLGPRDDLISSNDRPVFSLAYSSSRMKAEWCFVVDASCIAIMLQGLKSWFHKT